MNFSIISIVIVLKINNLFKIYSFNKKIILKNNKFIILILIQILMIIQINKQILNKLLISKKMMFNLKTILEK